MASWSDGYVTDMQYTRHFHPELAPAYLAFACLRQSVRPPSLGPGSAYLELGCGQGFGLNLLAAANPDQQFWGVDFNPAQIANAARLAAEAGTSNVTFEDLSFAQVLELPDGRLPKFDVIALHGVYSWVNAENRAAVVRILDRLLKPGGLAYVSYNCLPGWSANASLQSFIRQHAAQGAGDTGARIRAALQAAQQMQDGGAKYFESAPTLKRRIEDALKRPPEYLAHEYLNEGAEPLFSADVARQMAQARLSLAASANAADDYVHLAAPGPLQEMIQASSDRTWRETLLDYAGNKIFRRDIFVRGMNPLSARERTAVLAGLRFTLLVPADRIGLEFPIPLGSLTGNPKLYGPLIESLTEGPKSFDELMQRADLAAAGETAVVQALALLTGRHQAHPLAPSHDGRAAAAFNRAALRQMAFDEPPQHLAAAAAGTGVRLDFEEMLGAASVLAGEDDPQAMARQGWEALARSGRRLRKDGTLLHDQAANEAELLERLARFREARLPLLRTLGVL